MHGDAHYHDGGGKLNNERSALLFRLLFRKIEHMRIFRVEHFMKRFSILIQYSMGILEWFRRGKSYNTERKPCRIITVRERDDCVVNKFSISLVCGLHAQAANIVTFCFCLWELFNFYVKQNSG